MDILRNIVAERELRVETHCGALLVVRLDPGNLLKEEHLFHLVVSPAMELKIRMSDEFKSLGNNGPLMTLVESLMTPDKKTLVRIKALIRAMTMFDEDDPPWGLCEDDEWKVCKYLLEIFAKEKFCFDMDVIKRFNYNDVGDLATKFHPLVVEAKAVVDKFRDQKILKFHSKNCDLDGVAWGISCDDTLGNAWKYDFATPHSTWSLNFLKYFLSKVK